MPDNQRTNGLEEVTRKVVISPEDLKGAIKFWSHFEIPMPAELQKAVDSFVANPTIENQDEVKFQICKAIGSSEHEVFKDTMFKDIVDECRDTAYMMGFDKQLEEKLSTAEENIKK